MPPPVIRRFTPADRDAVIAMILPIQRGEFGLAITAEDQPDLADVAAYYQRGAGEFWVAEAAGKIVGTIALKDIGGSEAALRKMFVVPALRGQRAGLAGPLLASLLDHARARHVHRLFLGTADRLAAAQRFYAKHGFTRVAAEDLPAGFPRMAVDTMFYRLALTGS